MRLGVALCLVCATGCGTGYLVRAGWHEARILLARRPIDGLLTEPDLDPVLRERLRLALAVRQFADGTLGLRVGDAYTTFAPVSGDATVQVLSAARRDRLEAVTWWYPLVGRLPYRGFFVGADAARAAARLEADGFDTEVRPAVAFSTLGWFADPLLSTVADGTPVELAETVIHELFHSTLYVPGAATFNESAATFAGHRGAQAFFCAGSDGEAAACAESRRRWRFVRARGRVLAHLVERLRSLYARRLPPRALQHGRAALAARAGDLLARRRLGTRAELVPPNNARLLAAVVYLTDLGAFDRLAPTDEDVGPALERLVQAARGTTDPFAALHRLASRAPDG